MEKCYVSNHHPSIADVAVHWWLLVHSSFHGSVNRHSPSHHPLDACYNLVVDEPLDRQFIFWDEFHVTIIIFIHYYY